MSLIADKTHLLKPKTAHEVICERHELKVSYGTFKRFLHTHAAEIMPRHSTCRFETEPGEEVQIDYAKLELLYDPLRQKKRTVYAFIATLSFSRLKFVDIVYRQDQRSFIASYLRMFDFSGGVPKRLVIENLKRGVITPDLYDPQFNKAYQELAEHYGCFVDPARVRKPKTRAKWNAACRNPTLARRFGCAAPRSSSRFIISTSASSNILATAKCGCLIAATFRRTSNS